MESLSFVGFEVEPGVKEVSCDHGNENENDAHILKKLFMLLI